MNKFKHLERSTNVMHRLAITFLILMASMILPLSVQSQTSFTVSVSRKTVAVNQNFQVNFTLKNGKANQIKPPSFDGFEVISGPNVSQRMEMVNFDMTRSVTWSYILRPVKEGKFKIGKARVKEKGAELETREIEITVTKAGASGANKNKGQSNDGQVSEADIKENLFVKQIVSKRKVHVGEQLTVTYKLYHRVNITNTMVKNAPAYEGFWSQEVDLGNTQKYKQEEYNGKRYETLTLRKDIIFAQRPGKLNLKPIELETVIRAQVKGRPRSIFDEMFGHYQVRNIPFEFSSNGSTIEVQALPPNPPEGFNGAVGKFDMKTTLDRTIANTSEPVTLSVKISGQGNIRMIEEPSLELPGNFEVYDPQVKEYISKSASVANGHKTYDFLIVPRSPGEYKIPPIRFSYFDPGQEIYKTHSSEEFTLKVEGDPVETTGPVSGISKEEVELLGQDIRYIKSRTSGLNGTGKYFFGSAGFWGLIGSPLFIFAGLILVRRRKDQLEGDAVASKNRRAKKIARKRLKAAEKLMKSGEQKAFYDEVVKGIWGYISDKFNIDQAALSRENVREKLLQNNYSEKVIDQLFRLIDNCEMALFAPSGSKESLNTTYADAVEILSELEQVKK